MPSIIKTLLGGLALAVSTVAPTLSADMPRLPPPPVFKDPGPMPTQNKIFPYLRVDAGASFYQETTGTSAGTTFTVDWPSLGINAGIGAGVALNDYFRVDLTGELRAVNGIKLICGTATTSCIDHGLRSAAVFANAYIDLGHYSGFTPYVGGGLGIARHQVRDLTVGTLSGSNETDPETKVAWNVQAGGTYDLTKHVSLDANYRYSDLGDFRVTPTIAGSVTEVKYESVAAHDVRLGLRYYFD